MTLRDEQADILGGPILQRPESSLFTTLSRYHFAFKSVILLGLGLLVWIMCVRGLQHLKKLRELRYRKAMRRKHGIPDSDCRPFAVAYAAAKRAHLEREAQDRKKTTNYVSDHHLPAVDQRTDAQIDPRGLRRRVPETTVQLHDYQLAGKHAVVCDNKRPEVHSLDFVDRYNPNPRRRVTVPAPLPIERPSVRRASRKDLVVNNDNNEESRKRTFEDDESNVEHEIIKKSRIDGDELIDGDEQADWYAQYADLLPRRAFKEQPPAGNCISIDGRTRINDFRDEEHELVDEAMEGINEDEVAELKAVARGKKRDRSEAGSTFGGDDDDDIQNGRVSHHHRKRRTISMVQRKIEVPARGQKRDRDTESPESEDDGGGSETSRRLAQRSSKKKRGKKAAPDEVSEMSVDPRVSKDPLCSGRRVGDEWEAGGVQYKVGDKGTRLRLTLVKKSRNKYHMPQDSQHPDRSAALEIYVETWMTDEQYNQAEGRQELAWQEASRESSGSKTPDVPDSPTKNGKNLLWDSVKGSPSCRPFRQFMPAGASTRINPFEQLQLQSALGRRVASSSTIVSPILPGVADSPTRPGFRGFSKWEKQDREADVLARIRAKIEEQKKAQAPPQKSAEIPTSVTAPELGTKSSSVPIITFTPAPIVAAEGDSDSIIPQSKSNTSVSFFATPPSTSDSVKTAPAAASTPTPGFSLPSTSKPATTPTTLFPGAPTAPSSTVSLSPFPFTKPQVPSSTSTTASSSAIPNSFEKGTGSGPPSASTPSPSTLGATTQPQALSTENPAQPAPSLFARLDSTSSTSSPTATKAEAPALPRVSASATASQILKPNIPLFSFSGASTSTAPLPTSPAPSAPKFSFGQSPATSTFTPSPNLASSTASQPKPTFKFGQTPPGVTEGDSAPKALAVDESKKSAVPVSVFGTATGSHEPVKSPPFGAATGFGSSTSSLPSKPTLAPASTMTFNNKFSSTPAGPPAFGNTPVFSSGGTNFPSKSAGESKPPSLFGGAAGLAAGGSNSVPIFGESSTEKKPAFTFSASTEGSKSTSIFGGNMEGSKPPSVFGSAESSKPILAFGGAVETSKPPSVPGGTAEESKFAFAGATNNVSTSGPSTESSKSSIAIDSSKTFASGPSSFGPAFGKDDVATNNAASTGTQSKPTAFFTFGAPSGATGSMFGQPSSPATSGDSSQSIFGKPTSATPSAFGFFGAGSSGSSSPFTFGKPAAQNQKQEQ